MLSYREQYRKGGAASIALAYLRLHDVEKAMQWLDAAAAENDLPPSLLVDPRWDLLRNRPDFEELVNQAPMYKADAFCIAHPCPSDRSAYLDVRTAPARNSFTACVTTPQITVSGSTATARAGASMGSVAS
jgi:hypothetical protein